MLLSGEKLGTYKYWSSGTDTGCEGNFWWCGSDVAISTGVKWKSGNPDNLGSEENCVELQASNLVLDKSVVLNDRNCEQELMFICETLVRTLSPRPEVAGTDQSVPQFSCV